MNHGDFGALSRQPSLGWVTTPSPLSSLPELARTIGVRSLWVKRDDQLSSLGGGSKVRKLDYLLAQEPFLSAPRWQSLGAIGSGHLLALARAAELRNRTLLAHCFPQGRTPHALNNAALLARAGVDLKLYRSRLALAASHRELLFGEGSADFPVVPAGGTNAFGMLGFVRAGFELAAQVRAGILPAPDWVYVAFGSGGVAAGLSVGLALAGLPTRIRAVAAVERCFANLPRLRSLQSSVLRLLDVPRDAHRALSPVLIDHSALGVGYGDPTAEAVLACDELRKWKIHFEPAYSGKAMAALLRRAREHLGQDVLIWNTVRSPGEPYSSMSPEVSSQLVDPERNRRASRARRRFLQAGATLTLGLWAWHRFGVYPELAGYVGRTLGARQAQVLKTAAALIVPLEDEALLMQVVENVDRYVSTLSPPLRQKIQLAIAAFEQLTPLVVAADRFTRLEPEVATRYLDELSKNGSGTGRAYRAVRDLCLLGYYQLPSSWPSLAFGGPWVPAPAQGEPGADQVPLAVRGQLPRGAIP